MAFSYFIVFWDFYWKTLKYIKGLLNATDELIPQALLTRMAAKYDLCFCFLRNLTLPDKSQLFPLNLDAEASLVVVEDFCAKKNSISSERRQVVAPEIFHRIVCLLNYFYLSLKIF